MLDMILDCFLQHILSSSKKSIIHLDWCSKCLVNSIAMFASRIMAI